MWSLYVKNRKTVFEKAVSWVCGYCEGTEHTFLLFLMVTLLMLETGFMPSFCIAFLLFFSDRLCFPPAPPSTTQGKQIRHNIVFLLG